MTSLLTSPSPSSVSPRIAPVLPRGAKILLVGEAPGADEIRLGSPFVGASGRELDRMLEDAGLLRYQLGLTNVFLERPPENRLDLWPKAGKVELKGKVQSDLPWAWIKVTQSEYLRPELVQPALVRLREEIKKLMPNLIIALGNTAFTALTGHSGIGKVRGTIYESSLVPGVKVLGTYHPAAVLRQYDLKPVVIVDLMKAKKEGETPTFNFLRRALHIEPTIPDLYSWRDRLISVPEMTVDIETSRGQITCIGFAPSILEAYVVPFWDRRKPGWSYWETREEEVLAWRAVKDILESPSTKILQNGMYDVQYCLDYKWYVRGFREDTMIKHHALYPGLPKGLDFLGSLYCNERAWKKMRPRGGEQLKREE